MCTSVNNTLRVCAAGHARNYVLVTCFVALFGGIYERFSFGVWSGFMAFAFAVPLFLGVLPWTVNATRERPAVPSPAARQFWNAGISVLTAGCLFRGILDIYGTASALESVYWVAGPVLLLLSVLAVVKKRKQELHEDSRVDTIPESKHVW